MWLRRDKKRFNESTINFLSGWHSSRVGFRPVGVLPLRLLQDQYRHGSQCKFTLKSSKTIFCILKMYTIITVLIFQLFSLDGVYRDLCFDYMIMLEFQTRYVVRTNCKHPCNSSWIIFIILWFLHTNKLLLLNPFIW